MRTDFRFARALGSVRGLVAAPLLANLAQRFALLLLFILDALDFLLEFQSFTLLESELLSDLLGARHFRDLFARVVVALTTRHAFGGFALTLERERLLLGSFLGTHLLCMLGGCGAFRRVGAWRALWLGKNAL